MGGTCNYIKHWESFCNKPKTHGEVGTVIVRKQNQKFKSCQRPIQAFEITIRFTFILLHNIIITIVTNTREREGGGGETLLSIYLTSSPTFLMNIRDTINMQWMIKQSYQISTIRMLKTTRRGNEKKRNQFSLQRKGKGKEHHFPFSRIYLERKENLYTIQFNLLLSSKSLYGFLFFLKIVLQLEKRKHKFSHPALGYPNGLSIQKWIVHPHFFNHILTLFLIVKFLFSRLWYRLVNSQISF